VSAVRVLTTPQPPPPPPRPPNRLGITGACLLLLTRPSHNTTVGQPPPLSSLPFIFPPLQSPFLRDHPAVDSPPPPLPQLGTSGTPATAWATPPPGARHPTVTSTNAALNPLSFCPHSPRPFLTPGSANCENQTPDRFSGPYSHFPGRPEVEMFFPSFWSESGEVAPILPLYVPPFPPSFPNAATLLPPLGLPQNGCQSLLDFSSCCNGGGVKPLMSRDRARDMRKISGVFAVFLGTLEFLFPAGLGTPQQLALQWRIGKTF